MRITIIVAADKNNAIGVNGQLPWHLPQDLRFFKNITWAMPVIMGRKTFESVGKPLPGRPNFVISRNKEWKAEGVDAANSIEEALAHAATLETREIFIIGGGTIYEAALPITQRVYLTRVETALQEADTWFPKLDETQWQCQWKRPFSADEKHAFDYTFECWERISG